MNKKLADRYGKSEDGNFFVIDTIGVPHSYCIGHKHVEHASDHFGGMLSAACIEDAEKIGVAKCCTCRGQLKYAEHEAALLVKCLLELKNDDGETNKELRAYLLKCKPLCEEDKYVGFAFLKG